MSHEATAWAIKAAKGIGLSAIEKLVLWHLADSFNPTYGCFQSQAYVARECEISRATLNRALDQLERKQLLARERRVDKATGAQMSTRYRLACEPDFVPLDVETLSQPETGGAVADDGEEPCSEAVENPLSQAADPVSLGQGGLSHSCETLTSKEPLTPLPPSAAVAEASRATPGVDVGGGGATFPALLGAWGASDSTDDARAASPRRRR